MTVEKPHVKLSGILSIVVSLGLLIASVILLSKMKNDNDNDKRPYHLPPERYRALVGKSIESTTVKSTSPVPEHIIKSPMYESNKGSTWLKDIVLDEKPKGRLFGGRGRRRRETRNVQKNDKEMSMFFSLAISGIVFSSIQIVAGVLNVFVSKRNTRKFIVLWIFSSMIQLIGLIVIIGVSLHRAQIVKNLGWVWTFWVTWISIDMIVLFILIIYCFHMLKGIPEDFEDQSTQVQDEDLHKRLEIEST